MPIFNLLICNLYVIEYKTFFINGENDFSLLMVCSLNVSLLIISFVFSNPSYSGTCSVDQTGLKLIEILMLLLTECWD